MKNYKSGDNVKKINVLLIIKWKSILANLLVFSSYIICLPFIFYLLLGYEYAFYTAAVSFLGGITLHMFYIIYFKDYIQNQRNPRMFDWLDSRMQRDLTKEILMKEQGIKSTTLENLELVQTKILDYTKSDINKLYLIKAFLNARNNDNMPGIITRVMTPIIATVFLTSLLEESFAGKLILGSSKPDGAINPEVVATIKFLFIIFAFLIFIFVYILESHRGKQRSKIMEEIVDVCIKQIEHK
jgi:hypothetical protein